MSSAGSTPGSTLAFLAGWELMVIAMMVPASMRFFRVFGIVTRGASRPLSSRSILYGSYGLVWALVGCVALIASGTIHRVGGADAWLERHPSLLAGALLVTVGGFQFSALKRRCLKVCNRPESFLMRHYRRGLHGAFEVGARYGLACVGCCWALMALMVVLGAGSVYAMLALTAIMFAERALGWNERFVHAVGLVCVGLGALVMASPAAVPALAHNAAAWVSIGSTLHAHGSVFWCHV